MYDTPEPLAQAGTVFVVLLPLLLWCAWWLWCADWSKLWPVLGSGAWAPAVLLVLMGGAVWGVLDPRVLNGPGFFIPSVVWHIVAAAGVAALTLFCGWLQGVVGWTPPEFPVHPPAPAHDAGHGHH